MTFETEETQSGAVTPAARQSQQNAPRIGIWGRAAALLGPGLIAASAGNDAGGILTYSSAGAQFKYDFIWLMVMITICLIVVQEMCARMGAATGKGLADLIREKFGVRWTLFAIAAILISNGGTVVTEFVGIAAALEMFHVSKFLSVPLAVGLIWYLVVRGSYARVERVFLAMSMVFLVYILAALLAHPNWGEVIHSTVRPHFHWASRDYQLTFVALIGTTITPYMQIMLQSSIVEKGVTAVEYLRSEKWDPIFGAIFSDIISVFMILAATALFVGYDKVNLDSAAQAASALRPVAGPAAEALFAVGIVGASLLAGAVLPLSTSYSICEALGFPSGISNDFEDARVFYVLFTGLLLGGAVFALLIPDHLMVKMTVIIQAIEGCILPIILIFIMLIINDREIMPETLRNGKIFNFLAWVITIVVGLIALIYVVIGIIPQMLHNG